ncbi:MAG: FAD binding domain-containing protein [Thermoplasmata archaeon]|nr:FAD binding domain-containing protein [Thermoplasmata archaeon]
MTFSFVQPTSVEAALRAVGTPGSVAIAGGTDLLLDFDNQRIAADRVVSLNGLPWKHLTRAGGRLVVGSTLPLRRIELDPRVAVDLPGLYQSVHAVGGVPLRHRATMGGNLVRASPASDLLPVLLALEATVHIVGAYGSRASSLDDFLRGSRSVDLAPGELIESVSVPYPAPSAYVWQRVRPAKDISQVGVAVARVPGAGHWNVALGGVVPRPIRSPSAERHLTRLRPKAEEITRAAEAASEGVAFATDRRASEAYRHLLVSVLVRRALDKAIPPEAPS